MSGSRLNIVLYCPAAGEISEEKGAAAPDATAVAGATAAAAPIEVMLRLNEFWNANLHSKLEAAPVPGTATASPPTTSRWVIHGCDRVVEGLGPGLALGQGLVAAAY